MINGKKVVATIEARMTSSRLPGKVMMPLAGKPVMFHMITRHRRSKYTDEVVVATTTNKEDDPVAKLAEEMNCPCFRGSEDDVMGRIVGAGKEHGAEILVQGMADSPMVDWRLVDFAVEKQAEEDYDCASNEFVETFPVGLDVRAYSFAALEASEKEYTDVAYREHAGYSIRGHGEKFKLFNWEAEGDMRWPELRLTLDTKEDYEMLSKVFDALYPENDDFSGADAVAYLKKYPEIAAINSGVVQKAVIV